jgi:type IV secretion system protein VirB5
MLSVAAQESHEEAGESLDRLETMVGLIDDQDGLKAAVDLNTRITAELGIILTQIWRLEAAQGVSAGQLGVVDASTLAAERSFRTMAVDE